MLKEIGFANMFDSLEHECDQRNHEWYEVLESGWRIKDSCPDSWITKQVQANQGGSC